VDEAGVCGLCVCVCACVSLTLRLPAAFVQIRLARPSVYGGMSQWRDRAGRVPNAPTRHHLRASCGAPRVVCCVCAVARVAPHGQTTTAPALLCSQAEPFSADFTAEMRTLLTLPAVRAAVANVHDVR
jgi:hypothetical protein